MIPAVDLLVMSLFQTLLVSDFRLPFLADSSIFTGASFDLPLSLVHSWIYR